MKSLVLFLLTFWLASFQMFAQNGLIGDGFGLNNNWSDIENFGASAGSSRILTTNPIGTGNRYFRLVRNWSSDFTQYGPSECLDTEWTNPGVPYNAFTCGSGTFYINCPNTSDNYVFKTPNGNTATTFVYFKVQGSVQSVSSVSQSPSNVSATQSASITANLSGALSTGQGVYLRYTTNGWANSTVAELTAAGTTNQTSNYRYVDQNKGGLSYYRLLQYDFDGTQAIYGPISSQCDLKNEALSVFPNPTANNMVAEIASLEAIDMATIVITDLAGRVIWSTQTNIGGGVNQIPCDVAALNAGVYMLRVLGVEQRFAPVRWVKL